MAPNWFIGLPVEMSGPVSHSPAPPCVRMFVAEDLHMTVAFLGSVEERQAGSAWAEAARLAASLGRQVKGDFVRVQPLGNPRRPSALAALIGLGAEPLAELMQALQGPALAAAELPPETRGPLPHVTLGRIARRASRPERREALRWAEALDLSALRFSVSRLALYTWAEDRRQRLFRIVQSLQLAA